LEEEEDCMDMLMLLVRGGSEVMEPVLKGERVNIGICVGGKGSSSEEASGWVEGGWW
jgi:hypothetical protein